MAGLLPPNCTAVTASTGSAANLIGGVTLHTFSGLAQLLESNLDTSFFKTLDSNLDFSKSNEFDQWIDQFQSCLKSRPHLVKRWLSVRHLIIDEISMLGAQLFTRLDYMINAIYRLHCYSQKSRIEEFSYKPFGGIQLIVFGDFFQLPPVLTSVQPNRVWFFFELFYIEVYVLFLSLIKIIIL